MSYQAQGSGKIDREKAVKGLCEALAVLETHVPKRYWGYSAGAIHDAIALLKGQEPRVMKLEEAQAIVKPGTLAWLETSGGYDGTRYPAIPVIISDNTHGLLPDDAMYFYNTAGRAWSAYNREVSGWRLWTSEPTDGQRIEAKWDA